MTGVVGIYQGTLWKTAGNGGEFNNNPARSIDFRDAPVGRFAACQAAHQAEGVVISRGYVPFFFKDSYHFYLKKLFVFASAEIPKP